MIKEVQFIIPVVGQQYTDIRPTISGEDWDSIKAEAAAIASDVNPKLAATLGKTSTSLEQLDGGISFDPVAHKYYRNGKELLSGSAFASRFEKEFPKDLIATKLAAKENSTKEEVLAKWQKANDISCNFGTTIHEAMEMWYRFNTEPKHPYLKQVVQSFTEGYEMKDPKCEVFVYSPSEPLCGVVDVIEYVDTNSVILHDYKTSDVSKKISLDKDKYDGESILLSIYALQLNFYRHICEQNGLKVKGMKVHQLDDTTWTEFDVPFILDIDKKIKAEL